MASMKKQFKLAVCFFLLTVLLQGVSKADACQGEHEDCSTEACCDGYVCIEGECENEACEDHVGHECDPDGRDCCKSLVCDCDKKCALCKDKGTQCDPNACYDECCDLDCVDMGDETYKCHCKGEHEDCSTVACCEGYVCIENECENELCEDHVGHECDPEGRDCCEPLVCGCDGKCSDCTLNLGDVCNEGGCCKEGTVCSTQTNKCECKTEGDECDVNACFDDCCGLDCVHMGNNVYECHDASD